MRLPLAPQHAPACIALTGSLLINVTGQAVSAGIVDIQGAVGLSPGEGSWLAAMYTIALLVGVGFASPLIATFGVGRSFSVAAFLFAAAGLGSATAPDYVALVGLRGLQGLAAGMFSPIAFVLVFTTMRGPVLALGLSLLALSLLLPTSLAPLLAGVLQDRLGWASLFYMQGIVGASLALLGLKAFARTVPNYSALARDWGAIILLSIASAATMVVLTQGRRLYWLDSPLILWAIVIAVAAWAGMFVTLMRSPLPILNLRLVASRPFGVPLSLNIFFRVGFAATAFLLPQWLVMIQGYRPLEIGALFFWAGLAQIIALPLAYQLVKRFDARWVGVAGLVTMAAASLQLAFSSELVGAAEVRPALMIASAGQVVFLVSNLVAGGRALTPADGPTATLMFNGTSVGGTTLGIALANEVLTQRIRFHGWSLLERPSFLGSSLDKVDQVGATLPINLPAGAEPWSDPAWLTGARVTKQAIVLAFNDAFLLWAGTCLLGALVLLMFSVRQPSEGAATPAAQ